MILQQRQGLGDGPPGPCRLAAGAQHLSEAEEGTAGTKRLALGAEALDGLVVTALGVVEPTSLPCCLRRSGEHRCAARMLGGVQAQRLLIP